MKKLTITIKDSVPKKPKTEVNITRLSHITGYSKSHLSRVFAGITKPSISCLCKLAKVMDLSIGDLYKSIQGGKIGVTKTSQKHKE